MHLTTRFCSNCVLGFTVVAFSYICGVYEPKTIIIKISRYSLNSYNSLLSPFTNHLKVDDPGIPLVCCFLVLIFFFPFFPHSALQSHKSLTTSFLAIPVYYDLPKEVTCSFPNSLSASESGEKPGEDKLLRATKGTQEHAQAPASSLCPDPHHNCFRARCKHEPSPLVSSWHASTMFALWIIRDLDPRECKLGYLPLSQEGAVAYEKHLA